MKPLRRLRRWYRRRWPGSMLWLQIVRRSVQLGVLALLMLIPALSHYDNLRNQSDRDGIARHPATAMVHAAVDRMDDPTTVTQAVRGSVWTLKVGDVVVSDPLAGLDFAVAARSPWDPFLLTLLIPLVLTVLLGRVFCGWICPADLLFELGSKVRHWARIRTHIELSRRTKYALLLLGSVAGFFAGTQMFAEIYPPRVVSGELYLFITFGAVGAGAWFLLTIVAFELFVAPRVWCRSMCPGGALYSLLSRFKVLKLEVKQGRCTSCTKCQPVCEFGLDPMRGEFGPECNNCGLCIRACAPNALVYTIGIKRRKEHRDVAA